MPDNIGISLNSNYAIVILFCLLLIFYTVYIYKFTIPAISKRSRFSLSVIRILALLCIFISLFEPVISLHSKKTEASFTQVFIDNSNSIADKDNLYRIQSINKILDQLQNSNLKLKYATFDSKVNKIDDFSKINIDLNGKLSNFEKIINEIKSDDKNLNSALIISDGILNDGNDPTFESEKINIPIFTIGIGDTTKYKDVQIRDVVYNNYIYQNKPTEIEAVISNEEFIGARTKISLFEENDLLSIKEVELNPSGINKVKFDYTPKRAGEIKLTLSVDRLKDENNYRNNTRSFYLNVLSNKIKIGVVAGSPSADLSSITSALESNKDLRIVKFIQVGPNKFWNDHNTSILDSCDVLFLVNFPNEATPQNVLQYIYSRIDSKGIPYFILASNNMSFQRIKEIEKILPFSVNSVSALSQLSQIDVSSNNIASVFTSYGSKDDVFAYLPPIIKSSSEIIAKPESNILMRSRIRNTHNDSPLLIVRNIANKKSIALVAGNIWQWQLSTAEKYPAFFNDLINDFVKWLNVADKKDQLIVRTSKKIYSNGEIIDFTAELYDQTYSAIDTALITLNVSGDNYNSKIILNNIGRGLFSNQIVISKSGDYKYQADTKLFTTAIRSTPGRFSVEDQGIENQNTRMNQDFLKRISINTNGKYYNIDESNDLFSDLAKLNSNKEIRTTSTFTLINSNWTMVLIICLFAIEWFFRKKMGML